MESLCTMIPANEEESFESIEVAFEPGYLTIKVINNNKSRLTGHTLPFTWSGDTNCISQAKICEGEFFNSNCSLYKHLQGAYTWVAKTFLLSFFMNGEIVLKLFQPLKCRICIIDLVEIWFLLFFKLNGYKNNNDNM